MRLRAGTEQGGRPTRCYSRGPMIRVRPFLGCVALAFLVTFVVTDGLHHEPAGDEQHFLDSAGVFQGRFELEALRSYPELVTPLALVIWGELEHFTGDGLFYGRLLNLALTFAMVCLIALSAPRQWRRARLAAVGLLLFPYTLPLSAHLYTDPIGAFLVVSGTLALARGIRRSPGSRSCARSQRASTWSRFRRRWPPPPASATCAESHARWKDVAVCAASGVSLLAWVAFFGGLATPAGIEDWADFYPAPMMHATEFLLFQGLYALTGVGAYFVVVEALLFRRHPVPKEMRDWWGLLLAIGLAALFWLDPPVMTPQHPGGPIGRVARVLLPAPDFDWLRVTIYYVLALLCVLRFTARIDVGFWLVAAAFALAMKQQIGWEKYLYPTIAMLWTMAALGRLSGYRAGDAPSESDENEFTKQALPRSGFH